MMKKNSELRSEAREKLEGNWGNAALVTIVILVCAMVLNSAFEFGGKFAFRSVGPIANAVAGQGTSLLGTCIFLPISYAYTVMMLSLVRGGKLAVSGLFGSYNRRVFVTMLLKYVYTILWAILLIIPGIIKSYSYAMTEFIMNDNPELDGNAAIEASMSMMQGHKMRLFLLDLSFIGWILLCFLTMGIGCILLAPYMETARAAFYEDLKSNNG